jgi:hypothetical protein
MSSTSTAPLCGRAEQLVTAVAPSAAPHKSTVANKPLSNNLKTTGTLSASAQHQSL